MTATRPPSHDAPARDSRGEPSRERRTLGLTGLLLELALPVVLSAVFLFVAASYIHVWNLRTSIGLAVFGVLLVAASLLLSLRIDVTTLARRRQLGKRQLFNRADAVSRLVKFILAGLVIPIAAFVAANRIELGGNRTPMSLAIDLERSPRQSAPAELVGGAVLRATETAVKVQGIAALQAMSSNEALEQLFRILADDSAVLRDGGESLALSRALASFGTRATAELVRRFEQVSPSVRKGARAPGHDVFDRYFASGFEGLAREVDRQVIDPTAQAAALARLEAAERDLKRALKEVDSGAVSVGADNALPAFVLQTFLQMNDKEDAVLLAFARRTAADIGWSDAVRGRALLLIGKLGGKDDLDGLYRFLAVPSPLLQVRALQAIAAAEAKIAATGSH
ncbi:MAG: hypothetical protein ABR961_16340 [Thermoanaerobaculaceae bacterium]|jgi:hypothetical protein